MLKLDLNSLEVTSFALNSLVDDPGRYSSCTPECVTQQPSYDGACIYGGEADTVAAL